MVLRHQTHVWFVLGAMVQEDIVLELVGQIHLVRQNGTSSASTALFGSGKPIAEQTRETTPVALKT